MSFTAQVYPGQAIGFLVLGASLHDILTRVKSEPLQFPKIDLLYEQSAPIIKPVILTLPRNGLRLRFDGPQQHLRLIEVLDFTKSHLMYKDKDLLRIGSAQQSNPMNPESPTGPTFRHIYNRLLGPTFPGEYVEPDCDDETEMGTYVLSYPGIAFSFPLQYSAWSPEKDFVSLLSSSASQPASSMAIFRGESWPDARERLYMHDKDRREVFATPKGRELVADEVSMIKIYGAGRVELHRPEGVPSFRIRLGLTSPQELVANLGSPDAIYRKNDQKMSIHKARAGSGSQGPPDMNDTKPHDDSTDTELSSAYATDESEDVDEDTEVAGSVSGECFYNYFYHGFDVLLSSPSVPSERPPSQVTAVVDGNGDDLIPTDLHNRLVATKLILHGNVPGSYAFNRHRRCRWEIEYLKPENNQDVVNSETPFEEIQKRLQKEWESMYKRAEESKVGQRGMVLNRDWGDSPSSSCELLGGWEGGVGEKRGNRTVIEDVEGLGNTTLFGFPGLVFEVLKNGTVSCVTIF